MAKIFMTGITGLVGSSFVTALLKDRPCEAWLRYCRELLKEE